MPTLRQRAGQAQGLTQAVATVSVVRSVARNPELQQSFPPGHPVTVKKVASPAQGMMGWGSSLTIHRPEFMSET